jgi:hypothetical protein
MLYCAYIFNMLVKGTRNMEDKSSDYGSGKATVFSK